LFAPVANAAPDAPPPVRVVPQPSSMVTVPDRCSR